MNKIYKLLLITLVAALGFTSCDDKDEPENMTPQAITILERSTNFPAGASTGSVKFKANGTVTVSTLNQWITATVEGEEIKIECTQNDDLQGRTGVVTAQCNGGTTDINVIQEGILFQIPDLSELSFKSGASTCELEVTANAEVEVVSEVDWVKGSCEDGLLKIQLASNPTFDERKTNLIVKYGLYEQEVPISQEGIYMEIFDMTEWLSNDSRKSMSIELPADVDVKFETPNPDWITSSVNKNTRVWRITAEANTTGHVRIGEFTYTIGTRKGTIKVEQCDFTKDLASNNYKLYFTSTSDGKRYFYNARLRKTGSTYKIELPDLKNISIPASYDADTHTFGIIGGQFCGNFDSAKIYTTFVYYNAEAGGNYFGWSSSWVLNARPTYNEADAQTVITFKDFGVNPNPLSYLELHCFSSSQLSGSTSEGAFVGLMDMELVK